MTDSQPNNLSPNLSRLHRLLVDAFDLDELRTLCFDLDVRFDDLGGEGVSAKARELLLRLDRAKRTAALLGILEGLRPQIDWRGGPPADVACPYKGLHAFGQEDTNNFFGRETFTERLVKAVQEQSLAAVVGPSGSGKSSVVFAGLAPALRQEGSWRIVHFRPKSAPFLSLAEALLPALDADLDKVNRPAKALELKGYLGHQDKEKRVPLVNYLDQMQADNPEGQLLIIIDQFEELYTQVDQTVRRDFLDVVLAPGFGRSPHPFATLALTMRADFMGQALAYPPMVTALQDSDIKIGLMSREDLEQAIVQPAASAGVRFEPGLVAAILDDVGDSAGNLPLLEFALTLLWERQSGGQMTHAAYEAIGGVAGALAQHADETLAQLTKQDPEREQIIQRVMVQLVQPGAGAEDTRRVARRADLGDEAWALVPRLADARLLVTGRDDDNPETVEVIHEALIQNWGRLQAWMARDREFRMWQERLRADLQQWQRKQEEAYLLQGGPLTIAEEWLEKRRGDLSQAEMNYIEASLAQRQGQEAAEAARRRKTIGALVGGLVILGMLAVLLFFSNQRAQQNARTSEARALAAEANQWLSADQANRGLANAYQGVRVTYDRDGIVAAEAHAALIGALEQVRINNMLEGHSASVWSAAFNPAGTRIVTASEDGTARLWRVYATYEEMLAEAERKLRLVLSEEDCVAYFTEFDPAFCENWGE